MDRRSRDDVAAVSANVEARREVNAVADRVARMLEQEMRSSRAGEALGRLGQRAVFML